MLDEKDSLHSIGRHYSNDPNGEPLAVSLTAVGEVFGIMAEDCTTEACEHAGSELSRLMLRKRIKLVGNGTGDMLFSEASCLMSLDNRLTPTDAIILACMLIDEQAGHLITTDSILLLSKNIQTHVQAKGKSILEPKY